MVFSNNLLMGAAGQATGYEIDQSIRFNDDDAAYLYRDNNSAQTDTKKFTYSVWIKRGAITGGTNNGLLSAGSGTTSGRSDFIFTAGSATGDGSNNDSLKFDIYTGGFTQRRATAKLRDSSAWYHIVLVYDAANGTANDTLIMYVNGSRLTLDSTSGVPNNLSLINANSQRTRIGADASNTPVEFDGYMAEINMIDGQALDPTSFGETNNDGVWVPKAYSGSYGNNGFFIDGRDSSDLGDDESGNGNDFTSTGLAAADQMLDTPTNNFAVQNYVTQGVSNLTWSEGNLNILADSSAQWHTIPATIYPQSGKWGYQATIKSSTAFIMIGWMSEGDIEDGIVGGGKYPYQGTNSNCAFLYNTEAQKYVNNTQTFTGSLAGLTTNDVVECLMDIDNGTISWKKNGSAYGPTYTGLNTTDNPLTVPMVAVFGGSSYQVELDYGQGGYTPSDSDYKTINTANLPTPSITDGSKYFQPTLYNGTGSELEVDQTGNSTFQPDFAWIKNRTNAGNEHDLYDAVRGATKVIFSSTTQAESTQTQGLKSFDSDGFTVGTRGEVNTSGSTNVAWQWLANNTTGSTNDDGSVDSTVAVNTTAGFSICKFNPGGNSNVTFGHGLGVAPRMVIVKNLEDATNWQVLHLDQGVGNKLFLNSSNAVASDANMWQNTAPTSTVVSVGTAQTSNEQCISYVFAEVEGYSSIRSYTGNGSTDGVFVYTGFKPAFVILKRTNATQEWQMYDTQRDSYNVADHKLEPNSNSAESTSTSNNNLDFLSNGFKLRQANGGMNASGSTYIYIAFAENPFGGDGVAPATAR